MVEYLARWLAAYALALNRHARPCSSFSPCHLTCRVGTVGGCIVLVDFYDMAYGRLGIVGSSPSNRSLLNCCLDAGTSIRLSWLAENQNVRPTRGFNTIALPFNIRVREAHLRRRALLSSERGGMRRATRLEYPRLRKTRRIGLSPKRPY
jgi:hypothetical protein